MKKGDVTLQMRLAVKLLFRTFVVNEIETGSRFHYEWKIFHLHSRDAGSGILEARSIGRSLEHTYHNSSDDIVRYEFIGIADLNRIGDWWHPDQVWEEDFWEAPAKIPELPTDQELLDLV